MRVAIGLGGAASGRNPDFEPVARFASEAEKLGVDVAWSAEAWGQDAVSPLAFVAARTTRLKLGTGIMQISARAPAMTAMTALTLAAISKNRFLLGLGASGPQVVEGLHGRSFERPLQRMRETIEIVRMAFRGERLEYHGRHHELPMPGGEGKALRLSQPANPRIPIYLATLSPKPSQESEHSSAYLRYVMVMAFLVVAVSLMDRYIVSILMQQIKEDLSLTDIDLGWLIGPAFVRPVAIARESFSAVASAAGRGVSGRMMANSSPP